MLLILVANYSCFMSALSIQIPSFSVNEINTAKFCTEKFDQMKRLSTLGSRISTTFPVQVATIPQLGAKNHTGSVSSAQTSLRRSSGLPQETHAHGHESRNEDLAADPRVDDDWAWSIRSIDYHWCFSGDYQLQLVSLAQALLNARCRTLSAVVSLQ